MDIETSTVDAKSGLDSEKIKTKEQARSGVIVRLNELGVVNCPDEIVDKLLMIGENSEFNLDSEMICEAYGNVLVALEARNLSTTPMSSKQKQEGLLSAFLHDIGKAGPASASLDCQLSIIKLFSVKNLDTSRYKYVGEVLEKYFPDVAEKMLEDLKEVGIGSQTTMRAFWNNHSWWTHSVLQKYPGDVSKRVDLIASSHHVTDGENPCGVLEDEVPIESKMIGTLEHYVDYLEERMLAIIDKYQAALMRPEGGSTHEKAVRYLKNAFGKYKDDGVTNSIIEIIDQLGKTDSLFPKTKSKYNRGT
ncbi:MAG: hypothetical protein WCW47_03215 [Candidatus Paceibacterota bacterium]|jgi:hypothetical protein